MTDRVDAGDRSARWMLVLLAVALALRLPGHLNSGLWYDEIWLLVESIRVPFTSLFTTFESDNNHPLYSVLAWLSIAGFGEHPWSLRLPAVLFGVASVGMMWKLALRTTERGEAMLATMLLVLSYHHVWFSQNARGYTMLLFWTLAATYFLLRTYESGERRDWITYAVCLALATYTHASAVLVALAQGLVSIAVIAGETAPPDRRRNSEARWAPLLGLALAGVVSLGLHAAMLGDMVAFFTAGSAPGAEAATQQPSQWTSLWWTLSAVVESLGVPLVIGWIGLVAGTGLVVVGTVVTARRDWRLAALYVLPAVMTIGASIAMGRSLRPRFVFHLAGFGLLIVVAGLFSACDWLAKMVSPDRRPQAHRWLRGGASAVAIAGSLAILPRAYTLPKQDFEGALEYVLALPEAEDAVAAAGLTVLPYRDYYGMDFPEVSSSDELDALLARHDTVYVLNTIPIYLESEAPELADRLTASHEVARFRGSLGDGDVVVYRFRRDDPPS